MFSLGDARQGHAYQLTMLNVPSLRQLAEWHSYNLDIDPVYAHWSSTGFAIVVGISLSAARGAVAAGMVPPHERLATFAFMTRACAPLYVVPFVLGASASASAASNHCLLASRMRLRYAMGLLSNDLGTKARPVACRPRA